MSNCSACEELREDYPELIANGLNSSHCTSLKNDTGLKASKSNDDCEDYTLMNDCLIGNMDEEVELIEYCDWKDFMHNLIPNLHTMFKATNCIICGLWKNIHDLWDKASELASEITKLKTRVTNLEKDTERIDCIVDFMSAGKSFAIGESTSGNAYAVAGKGVSFLQASPGSTEHTVDLSLRYIAGGLVQGVGSFNFYSSDFTDLATVKNFDNGDNERSTRSRKGNSIWGTSGSGNHASGRPARGGELICEFRIKKSAFPQIQSIYSGFGQETGDGGYHVRAEVFTEGEFAYGQHGWCNKINGNPTSEGYDRGHPVEDGYVYVQLRMTYMFDFYATDDGKQYTPIYFMGMRMNQDKITC